MSKNFLVAITRSFLVLLALLWAHPAKAASYTAADIGPSREGALASAANGYDLSSNGRDIGGTADEFKFGYEQRTGNFDIQAQIEGVTITDSFVHAGLMARGTLEANSPFAAVFSSSALLGTFFESRASAGGNSQTAASPRGLPANYPQMYLRLRRSGNVFTGFASHDGTNWQQIATATVALPSQVYFGIALASLNTNALSTARFRDIKNAVNPQVYNPLPVEFLGPSNRRTGLIFSEIMYNPGPRQDGEDLEFVELFNAENYFLDLTGWKVRGGIEFEFPEGFRIEPGQFVVIAADPGAIQRKYGLNGVLGPYRGRLNNSGESVKLLNVFGATRLEVKYERSMPWPSAADGTGHSLVLARPSYGEDDPRAWAASDRIGGSPGEVDAKWPNPWTGAVLNEVLASGTAPPQGFIEIYNAGASAVDLSGCLITPGMNAAGFRIPAGTILGGQGFFTATEQELGFPLRAANRLLLVSPAADRVIDLLEKNGAEAGVSLGRAPDGAPRLSRLETPTPNQPNAPRRIEEVVLNEVMYNPITGDEADTYVELHNRSNREVDVSGWRLTDGIDFEFPQGSRIAAGGFLVAAKDAAHLRGIYPQLNQAKTVGDFSGNLSGSGERIALGKPQFIAATNALGAIVTNVAFSTVSEMAYKDGGRWPELADGGGSSLELLDPRSDTTLAGNWAASDESRKSQWTTVEVNGKVEMAAGGPAANRFQILMLGAGECLVDDVELIPANSTNILVNGDFEGAGTDWRLQGNHSRSVIAADAAFSGQAGLHVRAPGDGDTGANNIRGTLVRTLASSGRATIRARVKWLAGWPEVLFRVRGNGIELPARMEVPRALGSPGLPNSRRLSNAAPAIYDVSHSPALPRANESVVVTCRISDPDGVANPRLVWRLDPGATLTTVPLRDDGLGGDALAQDGVYSATISGRSSSTLAAFRIEAMDDAAEPASAVFPSQAPAQECLIRWEDPAPFGTFRHYHMWSTAATEQARGSTPDLDNTFRDLTLVYGNARIIYNAGFRDKGSPYHSGGGDFAVTVPRDEPLLGVDDRIFASTGNGGDENTYLRGDMTGWIGERLGIPFLHSHYMRLYRNGLSYRQMMYDMEQPNRYYAKSWLGGAGVKDDLFKIALWFEFDDSLGSFNATGATLQRFISDGQYKLARYRWNWQIRPSTETANDYETIFALAAAANSGADRTRLLPQLADMEEWMRVFAYHRISGNWDSYSFRVGQNMYLYAPLGQRAVLLPWDIDFVLGADGADAAGAASLFRAETDSVIQSLFNLPMYQRMLWRAYQDAVNGPLQPGSFQPQIDARRAALVKNGINATAPAGITTYINARRNYIVSQLARSDAKSFYITTNNGEDFGAQTSSVILAGVAPFAVANIAVNGTPFPVSWTGSTNWQITVPLLAQTNLLQITGLDLRGEVVTEAVDNVTVRFSGVPPEPRDWVVINEIQYHPATPDSEFVEIFNRHPDYAFDLSGYRLEGVDFTFGPGTLIQPGGYLVVVKDRAEFANAYGASIPVLGPYNGRLQVEGETLRLVKPGEAADTGGAADEVRYSSLPPWPADADGRGPSLQLIDAAQDNRRAGNWVAAAPNSADQATPGRQNASAAAIPPFPNIWINEVQPSAALPGNAGEKEPWLELFNSDAAPVDLSGLFLSDDPAQLTKWRFPAGTQVAGGSYLLVWLDGQSVQTPSATLHAGFRIAPTNGVVLLSREQGGGAAVIDYVRYQVTSPGYSYGSYPDGDPAHRRMLFVATPGGPNNAALPDLNVSINEWMAASQAILRDPADGQFQDWFELYNGGTNTVDLSGYYLTDNQNDPAQFRIPAGYKIGPGEYRVIWADSEPQQNSAARDLHVNFSLRADGEEIALFTPDEQLVTAVRFGPQTANISEGTYPDGASGSSVLFARPTPGAPNAAEFANRRPGIAAIANQTIAEQQTLSLNVLASDLDVPAQKLVFTLVNPPEGAAIDAQSGAFTWRPGEGQGPGTYSVTVRVADNGSPPLSASARFDVTVAEVNDAPVLPAIPPQTIDEGFEFSLPIAAADSDIPAQDLAFTLEENPPAGASIDSRTGEFRWTPAEAQGPGVYTIHVAVSDGGKPPAVARGIFTVTVRDVNNAPIIEEIPIAAADEGRLFTLQTHAIDPDPNPVPLIYSLENAPAAMTIDPQTGLIAWTPGEADGPRDYTFQVRVSEPAGGLSSIAPIVVGVSEVNTAPVLAPIADVVAKPGDSINISILASDADLPEQGLSFIGTGLPAGAAVNQRFGTFSWEVPDDPPVGTNVIRIEVSDDQTPALSAQESFNLIVRAPLRVAINEIMFRPSAPGAEYIELCNYSATTPVDLSGWRLEGLEYTFPPGTMLAPGAFLCVARDTNAFRSAYNVPRLVLGSAVWSLGSGGGLIRLIKPGGLGFPDEIIDEVSFSSEAPWPLAAAQAGSSLQLIDPRQDHRRVLNWAASVNSTTNATIDAVPMAAAWKYWQSAQSPGNEWAAPAFDDAAWPSGGALLYVESSSLPVPKVTSLTIGQMSYYFRTRFDFAGNPAGAILNLTTVLDDGAVFYLNGQEFHRIGMPAGAITRGTAASRTVGNAIVEGPFSIGTAALRAGENVLAAEVHQSGTGSTDIVLGAGLQIVTARTVSFTPNAPNSVARPIEAVPSVWINELMPENRAGIPDSAGEFDPWIELYNASTNFVSLDGWALTDDFSNHRKWLFPAQTILPAKAYLLVWLDGDAGQASAGELHASFRIQPGTGVLALTALQNGSAGVVDYVTYSGVAADRSVGLASDGNPLTRGLLGTPSPRGANAAPVTVASPKLTIQVGAANIVTLSFALDPGQGYRVETSSAADLAKWSELTAAISPGGTVTIQQPIEPAHAKYYRVVLP